MNREETISIRDPLHGAIELERYEKMLIEHPVMRRLRRIKQLGFADLSYPGATHTRFVHSVGAMWVATRMWESVERHLSLSAAENHRLLRWIRAAVLLHDIGHAPLSHTTEMIMPPVQQLPLAAWTPDTPRQANHEDYSLHLILNSSLGPLLASLDVWPQALAQLISGQSLPTSRDFVIQGKNFFPLLRQIVSSELDADRMDYLPRDAMFTGVAYGHFDLDWIIRNLVPIEQDDRMYLGLRNKALFTFEDFLLSRYHMFHSVYYHHTSVCYQQMLHLYYREAPDEYVLPLEVESYLQTDDYQLIDILRHSRNPWAQRIVEQQPYLKLLELLVPSSHPTEESSSSRDVMEQHAATGFFLATQEALTEAHIRYFDTASPWVLSNYARPQSKTYSSLFVLDKTFDQAVPLAQYSRLYQRYAETRNILRIYVDPGQYEEAQRLVQALQQTSHLWLWNT